MANSGPLTTKSISFELGTKNPTTSVLLNQIVTVVTRPATEIPELVSLLKQHHSKLQDAKYFTDIVKKLTSSLLRIDQVRTLTPEVARAVDCNVSLSSFVYKQLWPSKLNFPTTRKARAQIKDPELLDKLEIELIQATAHSADQWLCFNFNAIMKHQIASGEYSDKLERYAHNTLLLRDMLDAELSLYKKWHQKGKAHLIKKYLNQKNLLSMFQGICHGLNMARALSNQRVSEYEDQLLALKNELCEHSWLAPCLKLSDKAYQSFIESHYQKCLDRNLPCSVEQPLALAFGNVMRLFDTALTHEFNDTSPLLTPKEKMAVESVESDILGLLKTLCLKLPKLHKHFDTYFDDFTPDESVRAWPQPMVMPIATSCLINLLCLTISAADSLEPKTILSVKRAIESYIDSFLNHDYFLSYVISEKLKRFNDTLSALYEKRLRVLFDKPKQIEASSSSDLAMSTAEFSPLMADDLPESLKAFMALNPDVPIHGIKIEAPLEAHPLKAYPPAESFVHAPQLRAEQRRDYIAKLELEHGHRLKDIPFMETIMREFVRFCGEFSSYIRKQAETLEIMVSMNDLLNTCYYIVFNVLPKNPAVSKTYQSTAEMMTMRCLKHTLEVAQAVRPSKETPLDPNYMNLILICLNKMHAYLEAPETFQLNAGYGLQPMMAKLRPTQTSTAFDFMGGVSDLVSAIQIFSKCMEDNAQAEQILQKASELVAQCQKKLSVTKRLSPGKDIEHTLQSLGLSLKQSPIISSSDFDDILAEAMCEAFAEMGENELLASLDDAALRMFGIDMEGAAQSNQTIMEAPTKPTTPESSSPMLQSIFGRPADDQLAEKDTEIQKHKETISAKNQEIASLIEKIRGYKTEIKGLKLAQQELASTKARCEKLERTNQNIRESEQATMERYRAIKAEKADFARERHAYQEQISALESSKQKVSRELDSVKQELIRLAEDLSVIEAQHLEKIAGLKAAQQKQNLAQAQALEDISAKLANSEAAREKSDVALKSAKAHSAKLSSQLDTAQAEKARAQDLQSEQKRIIAKLQEELKAARAEASATAKALAVEKEAHELLQAEMAQSKKAYEVASSSIAELTAELDSLKLDSISPSTMRRMSEMTEVNKREIISKIKECQTACFVKKLDVSESLHPMFNTAHEVMTQLDGEEDISFIHGGFVRDLLVNHMHDTHHTPSDVDLITTRSEEWLQSHLSGFIQNKHHPWLFTNPMLKIDLVSLPSLHLIHEGHEAFLSINSLFMDKEKNLYDPTRYGYTDIENKQIRILGEPATRMKEDPSRILRLTRFWSQLGWELPHLYLFPLKYYAQHLHTLPYGHFANHLTQVLATKGGLHNLIQSHILGEVLGMHDIGFDFANNPNVYGFWQTQFPLANRSDNPMPILFILPYRSARLANPMLLPRDCAGEVVDNFFKRFDHDKSFCTRPGQRADLRSYLVDRILHFDNLLQQYERELMQPLSVTAHHPNSSPPVTPLYERGRGGRGRGGTSASTSASSSLRSSSDGTASPTSSKGTNKKVNTYH